MVKYTITEVSPKTIMLTRHEPIDPPIDGLPPYQTSTLTCRKSELEWIINILSAYVIETKQR